jgi:hypothetical protein
MTELQLWNKSSLRDCGIAIAEVLHSSFKIATVDIKKLYMLTFDYRIAGDKTVGSDSCEEDSWNRTAYTGELTQDNRTTIQGREDWIVSGQWFCSVTIASKSTGSTAVTAAMSPWTEAGQERKSATTFCRSGR